MNSGASPAPDDTPQIEVAPDTQTDIVTTEVSAPDTNGKDSMAKKTKRAKKAAAPKGERKGRTPKVVSGSITDVKSSGDTYLQLIFEEGSITLTPTSNRQANRDIALKAIRALVK